MAHYFDGEQSSPLRPATVSFTVRGRFFSVTTWSGIFSRDGLDAATSLLIEACELPQQGRVLDLGCGWGAVCVSLKSLFPLLSFVASDVNARAVELTAKNAAAANVVVDTVVSDGFAKLQGSFDVVLTNPPYAAGRAVCFRLIQESWERLVPGGSLQLVARHQKGGRMLEQHMDEVFGNVRTVAKKGGFRVYLSVKE